MTEGMVILDNKDHREKRDPQEDPEIKGQQEMLDRQDHVVPLVKEDLKAEKEDPEL